VPLVNIDARLDGQGKNWRGFLVIPVLVHLRAPAGAEYPGSPLVIYGVQTFTHFLRECSDATIRQVDLMLDGLAERYEGKCYGVFLEERVLAALLSGRIEWQPIERARRTWRGWVS
jgi:hypothetical protein